MTPISMQSAMSNYAVNARYAMPVTSNAPAAPAQLPTTPPSSDSVQISDRGRWLASQSVVETPIAAMALSSNEQVDAMAETVYMSQMTRQAIQTYSESYQMAVEQYQSPEAE